MILDVLRHVLTIGASVAVISAAKRWPRFGVWIAPTYCVMSLGFLADAAFGQRWWLVVAWTVCLGGSVALWVDVYEARMRRRFDAVVRDDH